VLWAGLAASQLWYWSRLFTSERILAHSDMYEQFLPVFLSRAALWSTTEFGGLPVLADPQNTMWYPLHLLLARGLATWSWYVVAAYVIAATGAATYAFQLTRSWVAAIAAGLAWPWSEALGDLFPHLAMLHGFAWLPWALYGVEKIGATRRPGWIAFTGFTVACLALSGHPQVSVYCAYVIGAYAIVLWLTARRDRELLLHLSAAFALGAALAAVQIVPTIETSRWIARDQVGFAQFANSFAKKPHELMTVLIPQFCHERREAPSYAGVATLWFGAVAVFAAAGQWRVRFWAVVAVIGLLLGLGSLTPLARVAYELPLYDKFRVVARHLALYSFAIIVLGAIGIGALRNGTVSRRRAAAIAVATLALAVAGLWWVAAAPSLFDFSCDGHGFGRFFPAYATDVRLQGLFAIASTVLVIASSSGRGRRVALMLVPVVLALDLLNAQSEPVDLQGYQAPTMIDRRLLEPSVHAEALREALRPAHQRLLPLEGSATDPVVPGAFARLWQIPSLGGYNPLLPERLTRMALMDANGAVRPRLLLHEDVTLDLFAVKYVIVKQSDLGMPAALPVASSAEALPDLDVVIGPSDCRPRGTMSLTLYTPAEVEVQAVVVVGRLRCGDNLKDGERVGQLDVLTPGGAHAVPMIAGVQPATVDALYVRNRGVDQEPEGLALFRVPLPGAVGATGVRIETAPMPAALQVDAVALERTDGSLAPLTAPTTALGAASRWREHTRFSTSRDSDRGTDGPGRDEEDYVVLENARARPRAWFVGEVAEVEDEYAVELIRSGRLRDGTPLDVSRMAMIPQGTGAAVQAGHGTGTVTIDATSDGAFDLSVTATSAGLAVVSELHHVGWRATVDGIPSEVIRVDHALMGVPVPAGTHTVALRFAPSSFTIGAAVSLVACLAAAACLIIPWVPWTRRPADA
jgi:hypothetical protein